MADRTKSKYDFPIRYFEGNLIFNLNGETWAVYEMGGFSYDFLGYDAKMDRLTQLGHMLGSLGNHAKIFILPIARNRHRLFENLKEGVSDPQMKENADKYFSYLDKYVQEKADEHGNINDFQFFVCVKLKNVVLEKKFKEILTDIPRAVNTVLNIGNDYIVREELELYKAESKRLLTSINGNFALKEASSAQVQWILSRIMQRGLGLRPSIRRNVNSEPWNPASDEGVLGDREVFYPHENELRTLFEGVLNVKGKYLDIETDEGNSIQTFLQFSFIPDGIPFPGGEYLKMLYDFSIPSEICITIKPIEYKKAMEKVERQSKKIDGQIEHTVQSRQEVKPGLITSRRNVKELESMLRSSRDPLLDMTISICVSGTDLETVNKQVVRLRNYYGGYQYRIERASQDQLMSFYQFIPGSPIYQSDYTFKLPPRTLAASMFPAKRELGDNTGSYIGTVGISQKPVFFSPFNAALNRKDGKGNRSPACFFMGTLGGGKSFNANLLTYSTIMQGARALIIDPKSERGKWAEELPELADHMTITTLSTDESDRGKLDPFNIYRDELDDPAKLDEAADTARNIIMELYGISSRDPMATLLSEIINEMKRGIVVNGQTIPPSMELLFRLLGKVDKNDAYYENAQLLARSIMATKEIGMAKLLFGTGIEKGLSFKTKINILQIDGLNMPDPGLMKDEYNESQRLSTILMIPIAAFAKKFANSERGEKKVVLLDESWALRQTTEGKNLFNYLARTGRSLNCCTIFIGHSVKDVDDEGLKAAITFKFCFKVNTKEEAIRSLEFMELEATEGNVERLMKMKNGHALFRDIAGNVDELTFDAVAEHIVFAFRTDPGKNKEEPPKAPSWD